MITYHPTDSIGNGYFAVNGKHGKFCDDVLQLFLDGMKADKESTTILSKWAKEADEQAAANERAWDRFNDANPHWNGQ